MVSAAAKTKDAARQDANATRSVAAGLGRKLRIGRATFGDYDTVL